MIASKWGHLWKAGPRVKPHNKHLNGGKTLLLQQGKRKELQMQVVSRFCGNFHYPKNTRPDQ